VVNLFVQTKPWTPYCIRIS